MMVYIENNNLLTNSLRVAEYFGRNHYNVLRDIENLECSEEFGHLNFELSSYQNEQNKTQPMYVMTRDGWIFLVMGYTGKKAAQIKESYIKAFNHMEKALLCPSTKHMQLASEKQYLPFTSTIELLRQWLEIYTEPMEGRGFHITVNYLHTLFNGWLLANRYSRVGKKELKNLMEVLEHPIIKWNYQLGYSLTIKEEFR